MSPQTCQCSFFSLLKIVNVFVFISFSRTCLTSQRKCSGPSLPERVPAGNGFKPHRSLLLGPGPPLSAKFHLEIQSHRGGGPETLVTAGVPERIAPRRGFTQVRSPADRLWAFVAAPLSVLSYSHNKPRTVIEIDSPGFLWFGLSLKKR